MKSASSEQPNETRSARAAVRIRGTFVFQRRDEAPAVAGRYHQHLVALAQRREQFGQFCGRQVAEVQAGHVQGQLVVAGAVAGQVDEDQVFRPAAFGQGAHGAGQAFPGSQRAVAEVVAVVDQANHATSGETLAEQVAGVIGLAQEHALAAIAAQAQGMSSLARRRGRDLAQFFVEQATLGQQADFQSVGQGLAGGVADALPSAQSPAHGCRRAVQVPWPA